MTKREIILYFVASRTRYLMQLIKIIVKIVSNVFLICIIVPSIVHAEYRAYELEVFDFLSKKSEILTTSFAPSDYIITHGGPQKIGIVIRASWICLGNTSYYHPICPLPH